MIFRKENVLAIKCFQKDWDKYLEENVEGKNFDACFEVGQIAIGNVGSADPKTWKPNSCGFVIHIRENICIIHPKEYDTNFAQVKDGIAWTITRKYDGKKKILFSGVINDKSLLYEQPCPDLVRQRMLKVAMAAVDIARTEHKLMHL